MEAASFCLVPTLRGDAKDTAHSLTAAKRSGAGGTLKNNLAI